MAFGEHRRHILPLWDGTLGEFQIFWRDGWAPGLLGYVCACARKGLLSSSAAGGILQGENIPSGKNRGQGTVLSSSSPGSDAIRPREKKHCIPPGWALAGLHKVLCLAWEERAVLWLALFSHHLPSFVHSALAAASWVPPWQGRAKEPGSGRVSIAGNIHYCPLPLGVLTVVP